jgi:hypothetical protein
VDGSFLERHKRLFICNNTIIMPRIVTYTLIIAIFLGLIGCDEPTVPRLSVDPTFREFYELLGGADILGPAISPMYEEGDRKLQFTSAVLLIFDPSAPESMRYQLASLGIELRVAEQPLQPTSPDGFEVFTGFLPLFRQIGGTRYTGRPLTNIKADPENKRIVQYFENVGFYQLESDPPDTAHLLDYGAWKCAQACRYRSPKESIVIKPSTVGPDIESAIDRLNPALTGFPLSEIYMNSNGQEEQIYENVVVYTDPSNPGGIALRPLPLLLRIPPDVPQLAGQDEGKFIAIEGNYGFNVPYHLDDYVTRNNGYDFIGYPISHYKRINDDLFRQCFENVCLDYHPNEDTDLQIRPMSLGRRYKQATNEASPEDGVNSLTGVTLTIWERYPVISSSQAQEIHALVLDNGIPLSNIDLALMITMPNGSQRTQTFQATDRNGQTHTSVDPINAPNGTLIIYEVCIDNTVDAPDCIVDDFLVWGNP